MTIEELKKSGSIIFECISGSRAYGLDTPSSDTDIRGVFILPKQHFYSLDYIGQVNNESNDIVYYELRKFIELCSKNNPNILELLNVPEECILYKHEIFNEIRLQLFLSKQCEKSFANYAYAQIKKARGLEKKIVNPVEKERKSVLDFCFVYNQGRSLPLNIFLEKNNIQQEHCGISNIAHLKDCHNLYHNPNIPFKGIIKSDKANDIALSSIPKEETPIGMLFFNKDGYSSYCKKYKEYWDWVGKRNEERYKTTVSHGKNYDSKNMMHTFRLLHMAKEIASEHTIHVKRPDREFLLDIKHGKYEYDELVGWAENLKRDLENQYVESILPIRPQINAINDLLCALREKFYLENLGARH
ncbi:nucleotidyltransferase domain-containing protein [Muricauda sp. SCSIO 64092]|uniref:nucleotidyltransferase domain-containing protein n=1 Tax=Allomuricauda sp. SCSIO 64092 TaxID=2908842 RepID=UPI001FF0F40C|nr:nucleotidyltransferase domain-containing protein [Muricauda sp. SCSIO 64092]UOY08926.1 nucleotidyltransferase domain-containing protein [Muricauda sp. SCSIO 64092]